MFTTTIKNDKIEILERIVKSWNEVGVNYAIAHGLNGYPFNVGRDIDVLIEKNHVKKAFEKANSVLSEKKFVSILPPPIWGDRLIGINTNNLNESIEIHTLTKLTWRSVNIVNSFCPSRRLGIFKIDPWVSFVKRILLPLLAGEIDRFIKKTNEFYFRDGEKEAVVKNLPKICGKKYSKVIIKSIENRDLDIISTSLSEIRRFIFLYNLYRQPINSFFTTLQFIYQKLSQPFKPCGPVVALVGPDGVGKSTLIKTLKIKLGNSIFTDIIVRHWRPGLLPPLKNIFRFKNTHKNDSINFIPRKLPGRFLLFRLAYYFFDFFGGYWIKDRIAVSRQKVVLYDRCALDMSVDPIRYGLSSPKGIKLFWRLLPKPDLIILLYDDPVYIHERKQELNSIEIDYQLHEWLEYYQKGWINAIIKVDAIPEMIAERVQYLIFEAFIQKNRTKV